MKKSFGQNCLLIFIILLFYLLKEAESFNNYAIGGYILNGSFDSRMMGMGSAFIGLADTSAAIQLNPAGLTYLAHPEFLTGYHQRLFDARFTHLGFAYPLPVKWPVTLGAGLNLFDAGNIEINTIGQDGVTENIRTVEALNTRLLTFSFGINVTQNFSMGLNIKSFNSRLLQEYTAASTLIDLACMYRYPNDRIGAGFVIRNLGNIKYTDYGESPEQQIAFGVSYKLIERGKVRLTSIIDFIINANAMTLCNTGAELSYRNVFLRAGYKIGYYQDDFTFGAGIRKGNFILDYAYENKHFFNGLNSVSLRYIFGPGSDYTRGKKYFDTKRYKLAESVWQKVGAYSPDYTKAKSGLEAAKKQIDSGLLYKSGKEKLSKGKFAEAYIDFLQSEKNAPGYYKDLKLTLEFLEPIFNGIRLTKEDRYEAGIEEFNKALGIAKNPELKTKILTLINNATTNSNIKKEVERSYLDSFKKNPIGKNIAVASFEAREPISNADASFITDFFRTALVKAQVFSIIDRNNMEKILAEQGFQQTGCTTQECVVQMGKLLNTHLIVSGSFGKLLSRFILCIDIIDVETGRIVYSDKEDCLNEPEIEDMVEKIAARVVLKFQ